MITTVKERLQQSVYIVCWTVVQWLEKARVFREAHKSVNSSLKWFGRLNVLPNSLRHLWTWLIVRAFTSLATALVDIPAVSMPIACFLKTCDICGILLPDILEWPFIVAILRHTWAIILLSIQQLDMPHLWAGWIISATEKRSLTPI